MARKGAQIKIEGLDELTQQMEKLKRIPQGRDVQSALLEGAEIVSRQARANAPVAPYPTYYRGKYIAPGGLRASLTEAAGRAYKNFLQAFAYTLKVRAPHAHLVEFGTKQHTIKPTNKKRLAFGNRFKRFAKQVVHPGSRPIPFFSKAVAQTRNRIKRLLESKVKAAFDALGRAA